MVRTKLQLLLMYIYNKSNFSISSDISLFMVIFMVDMIYFTLFMSFAITARFIAIIVMTMINMWEQICDLHLRRTNHLRWENGNEHVIQWFTLRLEVLWQVFVLLFITVMITNGFQNKRVKGKYRASGIRHRNNKNLRMFLKLLDSFLNIYFLRFIIVWW